MRIGLFYQIQVPKPWTPSSEAQRIYEALEQIPYAEQQGFESVWFSEHHFRPVWSHNSAPDLTLAAVSQRTNSIRLGRTADPYQLTPYGTALNDTRGMGNEFADLLPRIWPQEEIAYDGTYYL